MDLSRVTIFDKFLFGRLTLFRYLVAESTDRFISMVECDAREKTLDGLRYNYFLKY